MKKSFVISLLLGILLTLGIFGFFWSGLTSIISEIKLRFILLAFALYFLTILLWAERWKIFLKDISVGLSDIIPVLMIGVAVNNLTPLARVGGEPVRAYVLKIKSKIRFTKGIASALSELVSEFISQILIVAISLPILFTIQASTWILVSFGFFTFIYLLGGALLIGIQDETRMKKLFTWLSYKFRKFSVMRARISKKFFSFQSALKKNLSDRENLKRSLLLSIGMKIFETLKFYAIFLALRYEVSLLFCFALLAVAIIISVIPATPGSMGVMEGGLISFLILSGIPHGTAAAFVFIDRIITFWIPTATGMVLMHKYGITTKMLSSLLSKK